MANIVNNGEGMHPNYASIDATAGKKITEPAASGTPSIMQQLGEVEPEFTPVPQGDNLQVPSERPPVREFKPMAPNQSVDHNTLQNMAPVGDVSSILPRKKVEKSPFDDMLSKNLDVAVERTKKQISQDQEAIMEQIYLEQREMSIRAAQENINNQSTNVPETSSFNTVYDKDDNHDDFDESDYMSTNSYNAYNPSTEPEEDKLYNPYVEDNREDEDDNIESEDKNDESYGESISNKEIEDTINENNNNKTPEEIAEDNKERRDKLVKELSNQAKDKINHNMKRIDLSKFKVSKKPVSASKAMKIGNLSRASTADWVLLSAKRPITVTGLSGPQIISLNNTNSGKNRLNVFRDMFKTLYDGIVDNNKPDFESWLKTTKFSDVQHLYFAYYKATFDGSNFVHYTCTNDKCDKGVFIKDIKFEDMVKFPNEEFKKKFNSILCRDTTTPTNEYESVRIQISDNYVVDILSPSIWSVAIETSSLSESFLEKYGDLIDTVTYIDTIYLINHSTMELEPVKIDYNPNNQTSNAARKIRTFNDILKTLTSDQYFSLRAAINELDEDSDNITYVIPATDCPYCGTHIKEQEMAPDTMLFTRHQLGAFASLPNS